ESWRPPSRDGLAPPAARRPSPPIRRPRPPPVRCCAAVSATVLAALPAGLLATCGRLGHDAAALAARASLDPGVLADPDARIPFAQHAQLWEAIAALGGDVGLDIGA